MPPSSLIVGVDLVPIKPIPSTITFQSDITSDKCRSTIRSHLRTWKADTVLHDGAPNVGKAWVQDAFSQAELVLQAMKLATEFLCPEGTFVTKVFRSKDYNALLWVFNQLFSTVEATKPPSSRNVSAEIFVVCRGFKAPKHIDPLFLDPRSVFAELSGPTPNNEAKVFNPERKKRKREGYAEGDYTQHKEAPASEFILAADPIAMLGSLSKLNFEQPKNGDITLAALERLSETTTEIRECCNDLKVLGRKEFRALLRWRLKARAVFELSSKSQSLKERGDIGDIVEVTHMDDDIRIQEDLQHLGEKEATRRKRERRRENVRKQHEIFRMQMHMLPPTEIGLEQAGLEEEESMFALDTFERASASGHDQMPQPSSADEAEITNIGWESEETADRLDQDLENLYAQYRGRKSESDFKCKSKRSRIEYEDGEWSAFSVSDRSNTNSFKESEDEDEGCSKTAMTSRTRGKDSTQSRRHISSIPLETGLAQEALSFFDQDVFRQIEGLNGPSYSDNAADVQISDISSPITAKAPSSEPGTKTRDEATFCDSKNHENDSRQLTPNFELVSSASKSGWRSQTDLNTNGNPGKFQSLPVQFSLN